ncbi:MAG: hypothetical protein E7299_04135 [Lachnospiraceae bacterium]|nr:hypothetical protein [Lachnospiraceae bacterium]
MCAYDLYDFGEGLTLMNVLTKNAEGKLNRIDTYIGVEGDGFAHVGHTENLAAPGVVFSYAGYVRMIKAQRSIYRQMFIDNIGAK